MRQTWIAPLIIFLFLSLLAHRVWRYSQHQYQEPWHSFPASNDQDDLYLTPAGRYTKADIAANGGIAASQKYQEFQARHDFNPALGEPICPITRTKAHPDCIWTIDGHVYQFCCPPCIDEFVSLAKERPEEIMHPEEYVQP